MSRLPLLALASVCVSSGLGRSGRGAAQAADAGASRLRPTCRTLESGSCPIEDVELVVDQPLEGLGRFIRCVLSAEGRVEACHVLDGAGAAPRGIQEALETRRYEPVTFQGHPVPVPYVFLVSTRGTPGASHAVASGGLRPICSDIEYERCTAEKVVLQDVLLDPAGKPLQWGTSERAVVNCILRETGRLESCRVDRVPDSVARAVVTSLQLRQYQPVRYRGAAIPVAYELQVAFTVMPDAATVAFREAALNFLADQAIASEGNSGIRTICLQVLADEGPPETSRIRRAGWTLVSSSACPRGSPSVYAHLTSFQLLSGKGTGRAQVGVSGSRGEYLTLSIDHDDERWRFRVDGRSTYVE